MTPYGFRLAKGLETTLELIRADYLAKYIAGQIGRPREREGSAQDAIRTLRYLREQLASPLDGARVDSSDAREFARFTSEMDHLLEGLARAHVYEHQPLLRRLGDCDEPDGGGPVTTQTTSSFAP